MRSASSFQAIIRGRVQGVGFRHFARQQAGLRGVSGFVRNLPDGSVEVYAEGDPEVIEEFAGDLRCGPSFGRVESADILPVAARGFEGFEIR